MTGLANVDIEQELFWKEVAQATRMIEANHGMSFMIERGTRRADIMWVEWEENECGIGIEITEVAPKQPALIVPSES